MSHGIVHVQASQLGQTIALHIDRNQFTDAACLSIRCVLRGQRFRDIPCR